MKNALGAWKEISGRMAGRFIYLFLDFDGTLTAIARTPDEAVLSEDAKVVLRQLRKFCACRLSIISGRAIEDIKQRAGLEGIIYAGNHGLQIQGPGIEYTAQLSANVKDVIERIRSGLKEKMPGFEGVVVENKGLSLSVHYRRLKGKELAAFKSTIADITASFLAGRKIKLKKGKKVVEIMPPLQWDKGSAVLWLLAKESASRGVHEAAILPVYIGDDLTDEDAFKALGGKGISIAVAKFRNTLARYNLKNTTEVVEFLKKISELKTFDEHIV